MRGDTYRITEGEGIKGKKGRLLTLAALSSSCCAWNSFMRWSNDWYWGSSLTGETCAHENAESFRLRCGGPQARRATAYNRGRRLAEKRDVRDSPSSDQGRRDCCFLGEKVVPRDAFHGRLPVFAFCFVRVECAAGNNSQRSVESVLNTTPLKATVDIKPGRSACYVKNKLLVSSSRKQHRTDS